MLDEDFRITPRDDRNCDVRWISLWTGDAAGTLLLKKVVGTFGDNNNLQVSVSTLAPASPPDQFAFKLGSRPTA